MSCFMESGADSNSCVVSCGLFKTPRPWPESIYSSLLYRKQTQCTEKKMPHSHFEKRLCMLGYKVVFYHNVRELLDIKQRSLTVVKTVNTDAVGLYH